VGAVVDAARPGAASPPPCILTPARLALPDKGIDRLLEALARLRHPFQAVIAGDGPERAWLEARSAELGLRTRVRFTGWLREDELSQLYHRARVVAFPSIWDEPFGLVGLEAMAHARPVVAFDVGGVREWLEHGVTGRIVPRGDVAAFAAALDRFLADPELASTLGRAGRERADREFDPATHIERLERIFEAAAPPAPLPRPARRAPSDARIARA
jgi:glycosyltransferase involved in cell wall biosynthesis